MSHEIKYMDPKAFLDEGYLHEVNRLLLHPLGLALEVQPHANEHGGFWAAIWDCRDETEGIRLGDDLLSAEKAVAVATQMFERRGDRKEELGYVVQPVETDAPTLTTTYVNPAERSNKPPHVEKFSGIGDVEFEEE